VVARHQRRFLICRLRACAGQGGTLELCNSLCNSITNGKVPIVNSRGKGTQGTHPKLVHAQVAKLMRDSVGQPGKRHPHGNINLYLVTRDGRGFWVMQYWDAGKVRSKGLGSASDVSAREAHARAEAERSKLGIGNGRNGKGDKPAERLADKTFSVEAADYLERHASEWGTRQKARYASLLRMYAGPIEKRPVTAITVGEVKAILDPIWNGSGSSKGRRLRGLIEKILNAAKDDDGNSLVLQPGPAALSRLDMSKARQKSKPHPSLPWPQVPALMKRLNDPKDPLAGGRQEAARVLRFIILTGVREEEAIGADWKEFDLKTKLWTIPADRMKMDKDDSEEGKHTVPLSDAAIACLGLRGQGRVFRIIAQTPVRRLLALLKLTDPKQNNRPVTVHGFRSTMATWAQEQKPRYPSDVIGLTLAHKERNKVKAVYERSDLLDERRPMMEHYARFAMTGV
jgi:integrase